MLAPDTRRTSEVMALRASSDGVTYSLGESKERWMVGSASICDVVLADPYVSSQHCVIERRDNGALFVRDRRSRNGTQVDGNYVEAAELRVGSYVTVGRTVLVAMGNEPPEHVKAIEMMRGHDPGFRATIEQALRAAQADCPILIVGETGTGKDVLARVVHEASRRRRGPFVPVNCGAIPRELIGSELFGHERGAFTGAHAEREGYFVEASTGTLFLDELGELPLEMQPNLLRALEQRTVRRVGGTHERPIDTRIIAATNRLDGLGTDGSRLRLDLYHRVATVVLKLPPLRERMGDLVELTEYLLGDLSPGQPRVITDDAWRALASYAWPGNVRELRHAVSRAVALGGNVLAAEDFFPDLRFGRSLPTAAGRLSDELLPPYQSMMRGAMEQALITHGSIRAAATHMGMAKSTFADKAKAWGLLPRTRRAMGQR